MTTTSSVPSQRSLHLLDLENLVGDPRAAEPLVRDTLTRYLRVARWREGDHVIIASNPGLMRHVVFAPPVPWNAHATRGPDGADVMLLSLAPPELVVRRYARLVIGSGDGIFAGAGARGRTRWASTCSSSPGPAVVRHGSVVPARAAVRAAT